MLLSFGKSVISTQEFIKIFSCLSPVHQIISHQYPPYPPPPEEPVSVPVDVDVSVVVVVSIVGVGV